jgi:hypothetical protein
MGTVGSFLGGKARPERDSNHSTPSSAKVKKEQELYLLSPKCASMKRNGTTLPLYLLVSPTFIMALRPRALHGQKYWDFTLLNPRIIWPNSARARNYLQTSYPYPTYARLPFIPARSLLKSALTVVVTEVAGTSDQLPWKNISAVIKGRKEMHA